MIDKLKQHLFNALAFPNLMKIESVVLSKKTGGYTANGEILSSDELENTDEVLKEVPICIAFGSSAGSGIFGKIEAGQIVVVQYLSGNKAYPIVTGVYTDEYTPAVDDAAGISIHAGIDTIRIANNIASLYSILDELFTELIALKTVGSPATQTSSPDNKANFGKLKAKLALVLKE